MSLTTTGMSAAAITCAISPPIVPAPTTAALKTNMEALRSEGRLAREGYREPGADILRHAHGCRVRRASVAAGCARPIAPRPRDAGARASAPASAGPASARTAIGERIAAGRASATRRSPSAGVTRRPRRCRPADLDAGRQRRPRSRRPGRARPVCSRRGACSSTRSVTLPRPAASRVPAQRRRPPRDSRRPGRRRRTRRPRPARSRGLEVEVADLGSGAGDARSTPTCLEPRGPPLSPVDLALDQGHRADHRVEERLELGDAAAGTRAARGVIE